MPRIGIDARLVTTREGGIAEYTRRLIAAFRADPNLPYALRVFEGRHAAEIPAGTTHVTHVRTQTPAHHRFEGIAFGAEVTPHRLDLLHSPDFIPPRFGARRYIITVHDLTFLHYPQFQTPESRRYYNDQIAWATRTASHILADSQATRDDLCNLLNIPAEKITVHMLGVHSAYQPLAPDQVTSVLEKYKLSAGYILHVGTVEPRKNLPGLFTAYRALQDHYPDIPPLVAVGNKGWLYEDIFEAARPLGDSIIWLHNVPFADLPALYNGAAVLAMPSHYEGFGFPPLEAMACGIPTVVSNRGSLPEVVGEVGMRVDPDDALALANALYSTLTDGAYRTRTRTAGLERARSFTWEATAAITLRAYQRALE